MKKFKIVIVGGASTYTPGIVKGLIKNNDELPLKELVLVDINKERLDTMGGYVKLLVAKSLPEVKVSWTIDREKAFPKTDFFFVQIRPGGLKQREHDEKIPLKYGLVGQETCGAGGFAFAMRSIPAMVEIVKDAVKYAPEAWILNYSNPESMISEALNRAVPEAKALCLCDMPISQEVSLAKVLDREHEDLTFDYFGLNHFGWFSAIYDNDGNDLLPQLVEDILNGNKNTIDHVDIKTDPYWEETFKGIVKMVKYFPGFIPLTYLQYYFFPDEMVAKENPEYTRANYVMDHREKEVFEECERVIKTGFVDEDSLLTGVHGNYIIDIAKSIAFNKKERFVVNVLNQGAISNFREDVVVEVPCYVGSQGVEPIAVGKIPTFQKGLMEMEKSYEVLAVEACLEGDYDKALRALTLNLTIPSAGLAKKVLDDIIENNKEYFSKFKTRNF